MNYLNSWFCHNFKFQMWLHEITIFQKLHEKQKEHHSLGLTCSNLLKGSLWKIHSDFSGLWIQSQGLVGQSSTDGKVILNRFYFWEG